MPQDQRQDDREDADDVGISAAVHRNIRAVMEIRRNTAKEMTASDRIAAAVTGLLGTMGAVYVHAAIIGAWISINCGLVRGLKPFDPFPFILLAMIAAVEAIFFSIFILISQNRMQKLADRRAELSLQVGLLTEHELTKAIHLLDDVARRLGVAASNPAELHEIKRDVHPEKVVEAIDRAEHEMDASQAAPSTPESDADAAGNASAGAESE